MLLESQEKISGWQAVAGIINGMVGSLMLGLPVLTLYSGYASTFILIIVTGLFCAFSSWIYFQHLGDEPDIGLALKKHFKKNIFKIIYDTLAFLFLINVCIYYFQLIVIQWEILRPVTTQGWFHACNIIMNSVLILSLVVLLKYIGYGAITMVYGIFSILAYLVYLVVLLATQDQQAQVVTPIQPFGQQTFTLAGAMAAGFMIQVFLVPFLQKVKDQEDRYRNSVRYTFLAYFLGGIVYQAIALIGSFGIIHRKPLWDYNVYGILAFERSSWEVDLICVIYILHLYSVFPQFILIAKRLLFQNIQRYGFSQTQKGINRQQFIYFLTVVVISAILAGFDCSLNLLLMINGGIVGAIIIYLIPVCLHIYCMFCIPEWRRNPFGSPTARKSEIQIGHLVKNQSKAAQSLVSSKSDQNITEKLISGDNIRVQDCFVNCKCEHYKLPMKYKIMITLGLLLLPTMGILVFIESTLAIYH